jgi:hypothetical protein
MAAGCDGEDEESEAFDNCATCGMGWTENGMCYEDDPAGLYREESIKPPAQCLGRRSCQTRPKAGQAVNRRPRWRTAVNCG